MKKIFVQKVAKWVAIYGDRKNRVIDFFFIFFYFLFFQKYIHYKFYNNYILNPVSMRLTGTNIFNHSTTKWFLLQSCSTIFPNKLFWQIRRGLRLIVNSLILDRISISIISQFYFYSWLRVQKNKIMLIILFSFMNKSSFQWQI